MRKFLFVIGLGLALASCDKQDDALLIDELAPSKEVVFDFNLQSSNKSAQDFSQPQLVVTYGEALNALISLQSQDDFFNNGAINNAIAYIEAKLDVLEIDSLDEDALQTLRDNLEFIVAEVDKNIALFREGLLTGQLPDEVKPSDESPFRMFETVPVDMNGTVVDLKGIEIVQKYVKQGSSDFYTYKFVVIGENVELLPAASISWKTNKFNNKEVKPNKSITAINDGYVNQVGVEFIVDFVGVTEVFKF